MNFHPWFLFTFFLLVLILCAKPLGIYIANIFEGRIPVFVRWLTPFEISIYKITNIKPSEEMSWISYSLAMLIFNTVGIFLLYAIQRFQFFLPLNPLALRSVSPDTAFSTTISFITNCNFQTYVGESTMSYLTQMSGLAVQNFLSAATGIAILIAIIRGFTRKESTFIGNFWVDLTRTIIYILLPLSLVFAIFLVYEGVPQTFNKSPVAMLMEPVKDDKGSDIKEQTIALGPVASQVAIKQLGTNGGGFFNTNSAHPFENPSPLSNFFETLAILLIPAALCFTFGSMVQDRRQGTALLTVMTIVFVIFLALMYHNEVKTNSILLNTSETINISYPNMEGKEVRFGIPESVLWSTAATTTSNGSVNSMHDSLMPLSTITPFMLMLFSEVIFGGVGSGLYGLLGFTIIAVFVAGLMVGRTPEYLGKKIECFEMKMALFSFLIPSILVLFFTAICVITPSGKSGVLNHGPHGLSEILYAFSSACNTNGSAFAGLNTNTPIYNILLGFAMFFGRFWTAIPLLAIAGSLAKKSKTPENAGTLPTHTPLFIFWLIAVVVIIGVLNHLPVLALGPIIEHLLLKAGILF